MPQHTTLPVRRRAQVVWSPAWISTASANPATGEGIEDERPVLSPNWPYPFSPQHRTCPDATSAQEWEAPRARLTTRSHPTRVATSPGAHATGAEEAWAPGVTGVLDVIGAPGLISVLDAFDEGDGPEELVAMAGLASRVARAGDGDGRAPEHPKRKRPKNNGSSAVGRAPRARCTSGQCRGRLVALRPRAVRSCADRRWSRGSTGTENHIRLYREWPSSRRDRATQARSRYAGR